MKKLLLILMVLLPFASDAQFKKGDKFIGGNMYFSSNQEEYLFEGAKHYTQENLFSITPQFGFFINEKVAIGGQIGFSLDHRRGTNGLNSVYIYDRETNEWQPAHNYNLKKIKTGVFLRRYIVINDQFLFSLDGNLNFHRYKFTSKSPSNTNISHAYIMESSIVPSFTFFPSPQWAIEANIGYAGFSQDRDLAGHSKFTMFKISFGTIGFRLNYYLRRTK